CFEMLDCLLVAVSSRAHHTADVPRAGMAGIKRDRAIGEDDGHGKVLARKAQYMGGVRKYAGILVGESQRLLDQSEGFAKARRRVFCPTVETNSEITYGGPGKRRTIARIADDRAIEQFTGLEQLLFAGPREVRQRSQVEVVRSLVLWRAFRRAP